MTDIKILIDEITKRLVKVYQPREIYLFGSHAWGTPTDFSDIDIFIIVSDSKLAGADRIRPGLKELMDLKVAVDLLVYTTDEIETRRDHPSTLAHMVMTRGVKLYEAA